MLCCCVKLKFIFQDVQRQMIFPTVPDLTRCNKSVNKKEWPVLEKASPAYELVERQLIMKSLTERADQLAVYFN